jgi:glycosyltransferase involved in cell wall biosynthesis
MIELIPLAGLTLISLINLMRAPRLKLYKSQQSIEHEKVSVIIPARNEEQNIANILEDLNKQKKHITEIIVVDDGSTDTTATIAKQKGAKVITVHKPQDWLGKQYACSQGTKAAKSKMLLFLDADVRLQPDAILAALQTMKQYKVDLLSCFPQQQTFTWGERLIVPLMHSLVLTTFPLRTVKTSSWTSLTAANGQCMLINKSALEKIGGWKQVKQELADDMALFLAAKRQQVPRVTTVSRLISCRMYKTGKDAIQGFSKNIFAGFGKQPILSVFLATLYAAIYLVPLFISPVLAAGLIILQRIAVLITSSSKDIAQLVLGFIQPALYLALTLYASILIKKGKRQWKQRSV